MILWGYDGIEKVVLLGASSGIGYEMALEYARRGSILFLVARRKQQLDKLAQDCEGLHPKTKCAVISGDLTNVDFMKELAHQVETSPLTKSKKDDSENEDAKIDTLIICAGSLSVLPFVDIMDEGNVEMSMNSIFQLNVYMPIRAAAAFLPLLKRPVPLPKSSQKSQPSADTESRIVVISSVAGVIGAPTRSLYAATKHAVQGFFNSLRVEWRQFGIGITLALPGSVDTGLRSKAVDIPGFAGASESTSEKRKDRAISPSICAKRIIEAADTGDRDIYVPKYYRWAHILSLLVPSFIDNKAAKKYNF